MKRKTQLCYQVIPTPQTTEAGRFSIVTQYTDGGVLMTDSNHGEGYTLADAQKLTEKLKKEGFTLKNFWHVVS